MISSQQSSHSCRPNIWPCSTSRYSTSIKELNKSNNMKKKTIIIVVCSLAVLAAAFLLFKPAKKDKISLETAKVGTIDIKNSVTATGTVKPVTEVEVGTQVSGIIDKLYVDFNDNVKAGEVIAEMDKVTLESEYHYRTKEYTRSKALYDKELVSAYDYDEALYYYEKAKNSYNQSKSSMVKLKRNLGYATITSPIDGAVTSRAVEEGQTVAAGFETPTLFTIAKDLTKMQVIADVDEADIGQVKKGQRVEFTVDAYPDDIFKGTVDQVRLEATTESNVVTYEVVIMADNPDLKLKPGLTASVTIYTMEENGVLAVPTKSLRFTPDEAILSKIGIKVNGEAPEGKHVWVLKDNTITPRTVETGATSDDKTSIESGVSEGETVVSGLTTMVFTAKQASTERSPFMPSRPGGNDTTKTK